MNEIDRMLEEQYQETLNDVVKDRENAEIYNGAMAELKVLHQQIQERAKTDIERQRLELEMKAREAELDFKREQAKGEKVNRFVNWVVGLGGLGVSVMTLILGYKTWKGNMRFEETGSFTSKSLRVTKDHIPGFLKGR